MQPTYKKSWSGNPFDVIRFVPSALLRSNWNGQILKYQCVRYSYSIKFGMKTQPK